VLIDVCSPRARHGQDKEVARMVLFRRLLGEVLRRHRQRQGRTLRDVAAAARVSLGYLSEVERGVKEASSELLTAVCDALDVSLADVLREISDDLAALDRRPLQSVGFTAAGTRGARPAVRPVAGVAPRAAHPPPPAAVARSDGDGGRVAVPSAQAIVFAVPPPTGPDAPVASLSARGLPVVAA
jgi:transcriptional regulator with XRE-family HTH domain